MIVKINQILDSQHRTKYWLSKQTGISQTHLADIANGKTNRITFDTLEKICLALNCTPNDLLYIESQHL